LVVLARGNRAGFGVDLTLPSRTGVPPVFAARTVYFSRSAESSPWTSDALGSRSILRA